MFLSIVYILLYIKSLPLFQHRTNIIESYFFICRSHMELIFPREHRNQLRAIRVSRRRQDYVRTSRANILRCELNMCYWSSCSSVYRCLGASPATPRNYGPFVCVERREEAHVYEFRSTNKTQLCTETVETQCAWYTERKLSYLSSPTRPIRDPYARGEASDTQLDRI